VGSSTYYELASIDANSLTGISNLTASFTNTNSGCTDPNTQGTTVNVLGTHVNKLLDGGFWTITPDASATSGLYTITVHESGYTNPASADSMYAIIKRTNCSGDWYDDGTQDDATQYTINNVVTAVRSDLSSFSDFAITYGDFILPIELTDFTVSLVDDNSVLSWNTASEYNCDFFSIERSVDGVDFFPIGNMNAVGFSIQPNDYSFTDYAVNELGVNQVFYRLKMVDNDQSYEYSPVRWVTLQYVSDEIQLFPNPFDESFSIHLTSPSDQHITLRLTDISGKVIREQNESINAGSNFIFFNQMESLASGSYYLEITSSTVHRMMKVLKQ
jgi:hypothetical protein